MSTPSSAMPPSSATPPPRSGPPGKAPPPRNGRSAASRYLVVFAIGLLLGIVAVVMLLRALDARKTWEDRYPEATMHMLDAQVQQLRASIAANRCAATDTLPRLQSLRSLANDIEPAFADLRDDTRFAAHAGDVRARLDAALASPPLHCEGAQAVLTSVTDGCGACHQDFRR